MITYSLGHEPVNRRGATELSDLAKLSSEICERLLEMESLKKCSASKFVQSLSAIAQASNTASAHAAFKTLLHVGCGQTDIIVASYEQQIKGSQYGRQRGCSRQALHWQLTDEVRVIKPHFAPMAAILEGLRDSVLNHEDAMSAADGLRRAGERDDE
jgi:hypothetical protein